MFFDVLTATFALLRERWRPILVSLLATWALVTVVVAVIYVTTTGSMTGFVDGRGWSGSASTTATQAPAAARDGSGGSGGATAAADAVATAPGDAPRTAPARKPKLGVGGTVLVVLATFAGMSILAAMVLVTFLAPFSAAIGADVRQSLRAGLLGVPFAFVQLLFVNAPSMAVAFGSMLVGAAVGAPPIGILGLLVSFVLFLRAYPTNVAVFGVVASGERTWRPTTARHVVRGTPVLGGVVAVFALSVTTGAVNAIPVIGQLLVPLPSLVLAAALASLYLVMGGEPFTPEAAAPADPTRDNADAASTRTALASRPVAVVAAPTLAAAGSHDGPLDPGASWGTWVRLDTNDRVALQSAWSDGAAPVVHFLDATGAARVAPAALAENAGTSWHDLPAGDTWVTVQVQGPSAQHLRLALWTPPPAAATSPHAHAA